MAFKENLPFSVTSAPASSRLHASGQGNGTGAQPADHGPASEAGEEPCFEGLQILVVEDEFLLALEVEAALIGFGCSVVGPYAKLGKALDAARCTELDGAVLDINLNGEMVYPLAELLDTRGIPFVFLTGYVASDIPERFRHHRRLQKPLHPPSLRGVFLDIWHCGAGNSSPN